MLNYRTVQLAEEHRRQLLCDADGDREDLIRHRLELHRTDVRSPQRSMGPLPHLWRRLQRVISG